MKEFTKDSHSSKLKKNVHHSTKQSKNCLTTTLRRIMSPTTENILEKAIEKVNQSQEYDLERKERLKFIIKTKIQQLVS